MPKKKEKGKRKGGVHDTRPDKGFRKELADLIRDKGFTQTAVDEACSYGDGYTNQLLRGHQDMKTVHVYEILAAIKEPPALFFGRLCQHAKGPEELEELLARAERKLRELRGPLSP